MAHSRHFVVFSFLNHRFLLRLGTVSTTDKGWFFFCGFWVVFNQSQGLTLNMCLLPHPGEDGAGDAEVS